MKKIIYIFILFYLCIPNSFVFANGTKPLGQECSGSIYGNDECASGDCEEANDGKYYCDCDESLDCVQYDNQKQWDCVDGTNASHDLDMCVNKQDPGDIQYPINPTTPSLKDVVTDPNVVADQFQNEIAQILQTPQPKINIPGLNFSEINVEEMVTQDDDGRSWLNIPFLGEYLSAIYKYATVVVGLIAVIMLIDGGFSWTMSRGSSENIEQAKKRIIGGVTGVVIVATSYTLLYTINPELVQFRNLKVLYVRGIEIENEDIFFPTSNIISGSTGGTEIESIIGPLPSEYAPCSKEAADYAGKKLFNALICVGPCHCAWSSSRFLKYIGCSDVIHGNASLLGVLLEEKGWITQTYSASKNLPVGLLFHPSHVGVSLGNNMQFQSGTKGISILNKKAQQQGISASCQDKKKDSMASPTNCNYCAKIADHGPASGNYGCESNQGWVMEPLWSKYWKTIIYPPNSSTPQPTKVTCCFKAGGQMYKKQLSEILCKNLNEGKICQ